jgi:drug/metabolite transporter (DMT)-like permease
MPVETVMDKKRATLIGLAAIVLWSTMVGLIRGVSEGLGPVGGAAMIYTLSGLLCLLTVGFPDVRRFSKGYLIAGSVLFVSYEICLALSLGYANTRHQAIEVGMVNYLWPSLTIVFAILFNGQKSNLWVIPGLLISLVGVAWVVGGEQGLHIDEIISNIVSNPLSYGLAFAGAFIWAIYCTVTTKYAKGQNGITLFVLLTALALWLKFAFSDQPEMVFSLPVVIKLLMCGIALGFGYASWNIGILHGNVSVLATTSYFTPVLSAALAAVLLNAPLSFTFWQGALMVCAGSLLCWYATRNKRQ